MVDSLPADLMRCLADAEVEVVSWSADSAELTLRIRKEIGPEVGLLRLAGVSRVSLVPRFTIAGLVRIEESAGAIRLEDGESIFLFEEAWGDSYFVVAESASYVIEAEPIC